ncbi:uncharacterized protein BO96DRAFT_430450 [Aspergillus niger CBS 101883]|uniref:Contig An02c0460, genomic contig n=2 Tax=Aspergillus niger TaxID=5061 RepID=A2QFC3_ASPNC|nr:uncharacterized protein BO96DRAFT_430450 [Aspergillus niger CBS 101883]XP_059605713.1 uncharacterized protein An02g14020 [Aspergillus niger]PYH60514.1 hypothetical protein BO96DRAFT_430450 [Aspergillus niger CBS 101883]CAK48834.1 unnamed protein product [Aspergillus niger]
MGQTRPSGSICVIGSAEVRWSKGKWKLAHLLCGLSESSSALGSDKYICRQRLGLGRAFCSLQRATADLVAISRDMRGRFGKEARGAEGEIPELDLVYGQGRRIRKKRNDGTLASSFDGGWMEMISGWQSKCACRPWKALETNLGSLQFACSRLEDLKLQFEGQNLCPQWTHLLSSAFACKRVTNVQMLDSSMQAVSRHQEMKEIDGRLKIRSPLDNGVTC